MSSSWITGGSLNTGRHWLAGCGSQAAALCFGGKEVVNSDATEEYDGSTWAAGGSLATARYHLAGCGTQTAGLSMGGYNTASSIVTEEYDGSSWSSGGNIQTATRALGGAGTQTAGLCFGGYNTGSMYTSTYEYNGTGWSSGGALNTGLRLVGGVGTQSAALCIGGQPASFQYDDNVEEYDGSSWSVVGSLAAPRDQVGCAGVATAALGFGGEDSGGSITTTEEFDGTSWSSSTGLLTARDGHAGAGSQESGLSIGGYLEVAVCEEYGTGIAYAGSGTIGFGSDYSVDVPYPSNLADNDILIAFVVDADNDSFSTPSGWTKGGEFTSNTNASFAWFWMRSDGTETGTETFTSALNSGSLVAGGMSAFRRCIETGTPFEDADSNGVTQSATAALPACTTTDADRRIVGIVGVEDNVTISTFSGFDTEILLSTTDGSDACFSVQSKAMPTAGTNPTVNSTLGASEYWATFVFALLPAVPDDIEVICPAFTTISTLKAAFKKVVMCPVFTNAATLSCGDISIFSSNVMCPAFTTETIFSVGNVITYSSALVCPPFTNATTLSASISKTIAVPKFTNVSALSVSNVGVFTPVLVPPFISTSVFSCGVLEVYSLTDSKYVYLFTLTGAADGVVDVEIPMSSFQCRKRSGEPTYLTIALPSHQSAAAIVARPNGTMIVEIAYIRDGVILQRDEIVSTALDVIDLPEGGKSRSVVLTGYKTETYTPKVVNIKKSVYRRINDGKFRHRLAIPNTWLNPGDTVTIAGDTFVADVLSYYIAPHAQTMEVAEA